MIKVITLLSLLFLFGNFSLFSQIQIGSDIDGETANDQSGQSVSLSADGSIVAIGATGNDGNGSSSGHVRIYRNNSGSWTQVGNDIDGEAANDESGHSVCLSADGSVIAIGAIYNNDNGNSSGHVRIYQNNSGSWTQIGNDIDGEAANDESGNSVSLSADGSVLAIGARYNDGNGINSGHVRIYGNNSGSWIQVGNDIDGEAAGDYSGYSVSLCADGSHVAIGAISNNGNGSSSGHVRIYRINSGSWTQVGNDIDGEAAVSLSGISVSLSTDGTVVAIGAIWNHDNGFGSGHVRIYRSNSGSWTQVGNDIDGEAAYDFSGFSVSLSASGYVVAIGAPHNSGNGSNSGHVRIYRNNLESWTQVGTDIDGEMSGDNSGHPVSISADGSVVAIGAAYNDSNGSNSGHVRIYETEIPPAPVVPLAPISTLIGMGLIGLVGYLRCKKK